MNGRSPLPAFAARMPRLRFAGGRLGITARFMVVLVALTLCLVGVGWASLASLRSTHRSLDRIYSDNVVTTRMIAHLGTDLDEVEDDVLAAPVTLNTGAQQRLTVTIAGTLMPRIEVEVANVRRLVSDNPRQARATDALAEDWRQFSGEYVRGGLGSGGLAARSAHAQQLAAIIDSASDDQAQLFRLEGTEARDRDIAAGANYRRNIAVMVAIIAAGILATLVIVLWLVRCMLPRLLALSRFASRMADGDYDARLAPRGSDEIARLGRTLDEVAQTRERTGRYRLAQAEFTEALQHTADEREAQEVLRRHLERSTPGAAVTVLNRNNSADRLEPVNAPACDPQLREALNGAPPRSCLAVRGAATNCHNPEDEPLTPCEICSSRPGRSTCLPLLVGGEVIGAVLANHQRQLDEDETRRLHESVRQAAPVVANLRNLAISQSKASTDALTGLPNRRALDDTVKRMVAQAARGGLPLAALMLDLDHFKQINDQLGHSRGDDILAAFGAHLRDLLRTSDFAGRFGGEEFLVLLPETDGDGALVVAEKIRSEVALVQIPSLGRNLTTSIGLAVLPDHAIDSEGLERAADRALYLAKANGRNRIELATLRSELRDARLLS